LLNNLYINKLWLVMSVAEEPGQSFMVSGKLSSKKLASLNPQALARCVFQSCSTLASCLAGSLRACVPAVLLSPVHCSRTLHGMSPAHSNAVTWCSEGEQ